MKLLQEGVRYLERHGVPEPQANAEWLLAHALGVKRTEIHATRPTAGSLRGYRRLLRERAETRKPLAYLAGWEEFMGLRFKVLPKHTLVPRPETETLVEAVLKLAGAPEGKPPLQLLDVGAGTGCVGLSLLKFLPQDRDARLTAVELLPRAARLARENAAALGFESSRARIVQGFFQDLNFKERFHVIAANLPYIPQKEMKNLEPEVRLWEPEQALCGGPDGLILIRQLLNRSMRWLKPGGLLALEVGAGQAGRVRRLMVRNGLEDTGAWRDLQGELRVITGKKPNGRI